MVASRLLGGALLQRDRDRTQHVAGGSRFARPDFKLPGSLLHEHFDSWDDGNSLRAGKLQKPSLDRIVNHVEDYAGFDLFLFEGTIPHVSHSNRSGINDHVERHFAQVRALNAVHFRLPRQLLRLCRCSIQYPDVSATLLKPKHCRPGRAAGTQHQHLRILNRKALLKRTNDSSNIGVETVELAILPADDGITRARLRRVRVGVIQMLQNGLLVGHGYADAMEWNLAYAPHEILERFGVQGEINSIHVLATHCRVHDYGRERVLHGIAGNSVDTGGGIDLLDAINSAQIAPADLPGRGFKVGADRAEGENAAGANAQHAADDALLAHAQPDERMLAAVRLQELHHGHIVGERGSSTDDFVEVRRNLEHLLQGVVEVAGGSKIMKRDEEPPTLP